MRIHLALADILLIADVPCDDAILTSLSALLTKSQNLISKHEVSKQKSFTNYHTIR